MSGFAVLAKILAVVTVNVEDRPDGHFSVSVFGIPFFDSKRQQERLARKRERARLDREAGLK